MPTGNDVSGINARGQIVGFVSPHSFLLDGGAFTPIEFPAALLTRAFGINDRGQIVGFYFAGDFAGDRHGFLLDHGTFTTIDVPGSTGTEALGINNRGDIVGTFDDRGFVAYKSKPGK